MFGRKKKQENRTVNVPQNASGKKKKGMLEVSLPWFLILHISLVVNSLAGTASKMAGKQKFLSLPFLFYYGLVLVITFLFALVWQQVLKHMSLTFAFTNKPITMVDRAKEMGAETLIIYSFPRMQSYAKNEYSVAKAEERCNELGIDFVYAVIPDPQSDAGQAGTQQYCLEDVPKMLEKYGPNTAFWDINLFSSVAVIKALLDAGEGIYMDSSQSSPFLSYPDAFGIEIPADKKGDAAWIVEQLSAVCTEHGANGRFSVRSAPTMPNTLSVGALYSARYLLGETEAKFDEAVLRQCYSDLTGIPVDEVMFSMYNNPLNGESYDNYCMILAPWAML